ncbi:hypothetical protein [Gymnodinialimonas ulvae]|uniref:hypothetical protein n=1 Tax=Gymnodinialimonas ulvae TaxID=3126504 RepID=UPI0030ECF5D2
MSGPGFVIAGMVALGLLAFVLSRRFGARAGWFMVGCVALLNVPNIVGFLVFRASSTGPGPGTEVEAYAVPDASAFGFVDFTASAAPAFAVATLVATALGATVGAWRRVARPA